MRARRPSSSTAASGGAQSTLVPTPNPVVEAAPREAIRLVTYDRRCAGQSQYVLDWYTLDDIAADARDLLAQLGIERSIVIGSSMGGMVAQQYALALLNTGANLMAQPPWGVRSAALAERAKREGDRAIFAERRQELRDPPEPPDDPNRSEAMRERLRERRVLYLKKVAAVSDDDLLAYSSGSIRNFAAFVGYDFAPRLGQLDMPTVIIHGTADTTVPFALGEELHKAISQSELHPIAGAVHGILQYPEARSALRDWLVRASSGTAPRP
ncbi:MAG: alpha/beta hydrolase [Myxococcota bacterium]